MFGKSSVEIDSSVFSSSDPFVCNRCYKRLFRFEKAETNLLPSGGDNGRLLERIK